MNPTVHLKQSMPLALQILLLEIGGDQLGFMVHEKVENVPAYLKKINVEVRYFMLYMMESRESVDVNCVRRTHRESNL